MSSKGRVKASREAAVTSSKRKFDLDSLAASFGKRPAPAPAAYTVRQVDRGAPPPLLPVGEKLDALAASCLFPTKRKNYETRTRNAY